MADDLFEGLPPPSAPARNPSPPPIPPPPSSTPATAPPLKSALKRKLPPVAAPPCDSANQVLAPPLKSALKKDKPPVSVSVSVPSDSNEEESKKRLRFRTTVDATETQIIQAMQKISSHIKNPSKFNKASKLALQLIESGSVKKETSEGFFAILEASMGGLNVCNELGLREDYHALFTSSQDVIEHFSKKQKNQFAIWTLHAVVANDLHTDDSFVFSKAVTKIKEAIMNLPPATPDEDKEESESLSVTPNTTNGEENDASSASEENNASSVSADPFGLDDLFNDKSRKNEKSRIKEVTALNKKAEEDENKIFLKSKREALLKCLEIAAKRYRIPWTQTTIDILAKHAVDHVDRFTKRQREAIEKLWASIKEQQIRRKQGKSVTGKLDVNGFEWLQEKYSHQKISIRHAVGGSGGRNCEQWLG